MSRKTTARTSDQLERIMWFHERLKEGSYPSAESLAEHFGIPLASAYRDIEKFKKKHNPPLEYDPGRGGFYYSDPSFEFVPEISQPARGKAIPDDGGSVVRSARKPPLAKESSVKSVGKKVTVESGGDGETTQPAVTTAVAEPQAIPAEKAIKPKNLITGSELVSVVVAEQILKKYKSSPFYDAIKNAFEKLLSILDDNVTYDSGSLERIISVDIPLAPSVDLSIFDALVYAIENRETVILKYFSGQKATLTDKPCDPYHILNHKDNWYLVAFCHEKNDFRDFLLNRIISVLFTGTSFVPKPGFSIEEHKKTSQLFRGMEKPIEVTIEFDRYAAHWIRIRPVHPTQKIVERTDGSLEISFKVFSYENVIRWVLSFGEHARILSPSDLQERVRKSISRMNFLYNRF